MDGVDEEEGVRCSEEGQLKVDGNVKKGYNIIFALKISARTCGQYHCYNNNTTNNTSA